MPLTRERLQLAQSIAQAAQRLGGASAREFIENSCADDAELRSAVDAEIAESPTLTVSALEIPIGPGRVVGRYRITGVLGGGGMGVVYAATDTVLGRTVALKFLPPFVQSGVARERFLREAIAAAAIDDPHVCPVFGIEDADGQPYIAMAHCPGGSLKERIDAGPMPAREALRIASEIAGGLAAAHARGIVHRDIKPSNILFSETGIARIADFGLARMAQSAELTAPGRTVGTVAYMAPEQALGQEAGPAADIWALGVVLFEMLTGRRPFAGESAPVLLRAIVESEPRLDGVDAAATRIISRAMRKDPARRYESAAAMRDEIDAVRAVMTVSALQTARRAPRVSGRSAAIAGAALGAILLALILQPRAATGKPKQAVVLAANTEADPAIKQIDDGVVAAVTDALASARGAGPRVASVSDVESARVTDAAGAREKLGADVVLTCALRREGNGVSATLDSVDPKRGAVTASTTVSVASGDVSALEADVLQSAARLLGVTVTASRDPVSELRQANPAAFQSWLRARGLLARSYDAPGVDSAIAALQPATANNAAALASLCEAYRLKFERVKDASLLDAAAGPCLRAVQLAPGYAPALIERGMYRADRGDDHAAIEDLEHALAIDPQSAEAPVDLASEYGKIGLPAKAEAALRALVHQHPDSWSAYRRLGLLYFEQGRYEEAIASFRRVVELTPDSAAAYANLGMTLCESEHLAEAEKDLKRSLELGPTFATWSNLGNLYLREERFGEAGAAYNKAIELDPNQDRVWANLAAAYSRMPGKTDQSNDAYRKAAELCRKTLAANPNDALALSNLASYEAFTGQRLNPLTEIQKALALAPADDDVLYNAAETYEYLGFREQALDCIGRMLKQGYPEKDLARSVVLRDLRKDARYKALTNR